MRISDWSSDVCSSDLPAPSARRVQPRPHAPRHIAHPGVAAPVRGLVARDLVELLQRGAHHVLAVGEHVAIDRKSVVSGRRVSVWVDIGGRRSIKKKKIKDHHTGPAHTTKYRLN